jgi:DNA repair exonuclease SbcCD ATPase subunit
MKNWNASASKFYAEIMNGMATFFGLNAEETTEAELHQQLIEAGSLAEIRAAALSEASAAVMQQMAEFQTKLDALQASVDTLKEEGESKAQQVEQLTTDLETVRGQLAEKDTEISGHLLQIQTLSGTVATLKAGKPVDKFTPADQSKPVEQGKSTNGGMVVSAKELEEAYAKVAGQN